MDYQTYADEMAKSRGLIDVDFNQVYYGKIAAAERSIGSTILPNSATEPSELQIIISRLTEASDRAQRVCAIANKFFDRTYGPVPCDGTNSDCKDYIPDHHIGRAHYELDKILSRLMELEASAERLCRIG